MKKYSGYPETVDSNIPWLGKIPQNWKLHQLKRAVSGCVNGIWGEEADGENDIAVIRVADFDRAKSRVNVNEFTIRSIPAKDRKGRLIEHGDLLIEKSGGGEKQLVGAVVIHEWPLPAVTSNFVARMPPQRGYDSSFLRYVFDHLYSGRVNYPSIKQTTGIQNLDTNQYLAEYFSFPEQSAQKQIAAFLDHETAKIDRLIARQERLIELLKEKRQAVISHAVTKGLNPDAPMKDSGVEWLGEVPAHWTVSRVGFMSKLIQTGPFGSQLHAEDYVDGGIPVINPANIQAGEIVPDEQVTVDEATAKVLQRHQLIENEIIFARRGELGRCALVTTDEKGWICGTGSLKISLKTEKVEPAFVAIFLGISGVKEELSLSSKGSTMENLNTEILSRVTLACPEKDEQLEILEYLSETGRKLGKLLQRAEDAVNLLKEHRTALISAAVTGKIDVRGWQTPNTQPQEAATAASA